MAYERMLKRGLRLDGVVVTPSDTCTSYVARADEVGDDLMGSALADADGFRDLTHSRVRIAGDAKEHVRVRRQKRPASLLFST